MIFKNESVSDIQLTLFISIPTLSFPDTDFQRWSGRWRIFLIAKEDPAKKQNLTYSLSQTLSNLNHPFR